MMVSCGRMDGGGGTIWPRDRLPTFNPSNSEDRLGTIRSSTLTAFLSWPGINLASQAAYLIEGKMHNSLGSAKAAVAAVGSGELCCPCGSSRRTKYRGKAYDPTTFAVIGPAVHAEGCCANDGSTSRHGEGPVRGRSTRRRGRSRLGGYQCVAQRGLRPKRQL